mmetsp:Transcript_105545/g.305132  ORF Transcript_105545/g.305132 Transcript_105545/m.305132 type:complete len:211 (-) Transcript_105545:168-800(-)
MRLLLLPSRPVMISVCGAFLSLDWNSSFAVSVPPAGLVLVASFKWSFPSSYSSSFSSAALAAPPGDDGMAPTTPPPDFFHSIPPRPSSCPPAAAAARAVQDLLEIVMSPLSVRPQNTPLSWIATDIVLDSTCPIATPLPCSIRICVSGGAPTGMNRACGEVHMAADSNVDAEELALTASMRTTGFDETFVHLIAGSALDPASTAVFGSAP